MSTGLGQTRDPRQLVPGDVAAIVNTMWAMRSYADVLLEAGEGLQRINTTDGWSGPAADQFRSRFHGQPEKWTEAGTCFRSAADALDTYALCLQRAQNQAASAINLWDDGQRQTAAAADAYERAGRPGAFHDPGEAIRRDGQNLLNGARTDVAAAAQVAQHEVGAARDKAPEEPGFWSKVGAVAGAIGTVAQDMFVDTVNGVASFGNAMLNHPGDTATLLAGALLTDVSLGGEALGIGLDATGVGALAGVPLNVISAAGVTAGVGLMGVAGLDLAQHAANEDRVEVMQSSRGTGSGSRGTAGTKTDRLKEHLTDRDLDAARREANGEVVATKPDGTPWDHVDEVRNAQQGLVNRIQRIQRELGDTRLSDADRAALTSELSEASRLLDYSEQFLPRI